MNEKKTALLLKLKALAERGVGGEKVNAERMLKELMKKYKITDIEIETDQVEWRVFTVPRFRLLNKLFWQVLINTIEVTSYFKTNKRDVFKFKCTYSEQVEILAKYKFYEHHLQNDLDAFLIAFVQKNKLFSLVKSNKEPREMSDEDLLKYRKAEMMKMGMDRYHYDSKLQLEAGDS